MFEGEVKYRIAKWILLNMERDGFITDDELCLACIEMAKYYEAPFFEVENFDNGIGDGVIIGER